MNDTMDYVLYVKCFPGKSVLIYTAIFSELEPYSVMPSAIQITKLKLLSFEV